MAPSGRLAPAIRRFLRLASACAVLVTLAAPAALGPTLGPVLRAVGAAQTHLCKCGMKPGTCGCRECDRLEHERRVAHERDAVPALKSQCDDDVPGVVASSLPLALLAPSTETPVAERGAREPCPVADMLPPLRDPDPPTPPPRLVTA